jgi:hypothetical protein
VIRKKFRDVSEKRTTSISVLFAYSSIVKLEAVRSFEKSVNFNRTAQGYNPEYGTVNSPSNNNNNNNNNNNSVA